jgi:hypothetical protein
MIRSRPGIYRTESYGALTRFGHENTVVADRAPEPIARCDELGTSPRS